MNILAASDDRHQETVIMGGRGIFVNFALLCLVSSLYLSSISGLNEMRHTPNTRHWCREYSISL